MEHEQLLDYVREPIPELRVYDEAGTAVDLGDLAVTMPVLVVRLSGYPQPSTLELTSFWSRTLPAVRIQVVLDGGSTPSRGTAGPPHPVLQDRDGVVTQRWGDVREPFAVLLGCDGLIAGGPVTGLSQMQLFVDDISSALDGGERPREAGRRALVTYVEGDSHLLQQLLALRRSWLALESDDTDIVVFGPDDVLDGLPDDLVKIPQRPAADDPAWQGYRFINSIAALNGDGSERLLDYTHLLRTDVDTFLMPGWNTFRPSGFRWGTGGYSGDTPAVHRNIVALAELHGLQHRGHVNVGSTWYGSAPLVREAASITETLTKYLLSVTFAKDHGAWPGWFRGVASMYAGEIAANHCAPDGERSKDLDTPSTALTAADPVVHVHCWHTDRDFSKTRLSSGGYSLQDLPKLPAGSVARLALEYALASLIDQRGARERMQRHAI